VIDPGRVEYLDMVDKLEAADVGRIGFEEKGDVAGYGYEPFMRYVSQDGDAVPVNGIH